MARVKSGGSRMGEEHRNFLVSEQNKQGGHEFVLSLGDQEDGGHVRRNH